MLDWILKYIGGGVVVIVGYIIISNMLWLIFGSKLLQALPGVNIKGSSGTLKIAVMLVMSIAGLLYWLIKFPFALIGLANKKKVIECMSDCIKYASKKISKRKNFRNGTH